MAFTASSNAQQHVCPPYDDLLTWQQADLPEHLWDEVSRHVETYRNCLAAVEALVAADPIVASLVQGPPPCCAEDDRVINLIVAHLRTSHLSAACETEMDIADTRLDFLRPEGNSGALGVLGSYRVERLLDAGGMGLVFQAEDLQLQRPVALKVLRPEIGRRPQAQVRFLREARTLAAVRHPHVITVYHVGQANGASFLAMELLYGETLESRCRAGRMPLSEVVRIGRAIALGLAAVHEQGLIHRDVKPDNIWLEEPSGNVKLLDFGLARFAEDDCGITQSGMIVGTLAYLAPEQAAGQTVDARTDLFGLGCVLFRLLTGRFPFEGESNLALLQAIATYSPPPTRQLNPDVPPELDALVTKLLAKRPAERPDSAATVAELLAMIDRDCLGERVPGASAPGASAAISPIKARADSKSRSLHSPTKHARQDSSRANQQVRRPRLSGVYRFVIVLVVTMILGAAAAVSVLRISTAQGEIVIATSDPRVSVLVDQGAVKLRDRDSGREYILRLGSQQKPNGRYEFEVTDEAAGLTFDTPRFTLRRGKPEIVDVRFEARPSIAAAGTPQAPTPPVPADRLRSEDIPPELLAVDGLVGAPPELVAVLGGNHLFPTEAPARFSAYTRYSPDGRLLATNANRDVLVYDAATGQVRHRLSHDQPAGWFDFRPDNRALAVQWREGIEVWDLQSGESLARLTGLASSAIGLTYTVDGRSLVTTDTDGHARLWDMQTQRVARTFEPPEGIRFVQPP